MGKTIAKLMFLLIVVGSIISALHYLGSRVDNQNKYTHPITRPGVRW